nr:MAG TPA: YopX protein [Caudoviricetes sp.]
MKIENIKFKAKRLDNGKWVCGYYYEENGNTYIIEDRQKDSVLNRNEAVLIEPSTVCMYTGLKDCEGNEIWEGDILEGEPNCEIVFFKGTFATRFINYNGEECVDPLHYFIKEDGTVECKVIGNIYEQKRTMRIKISQRKEKEESQCQSTND